MIDREQNLRLGDARKLSQMMQGESVPSSGLSKQMAEELLSEDLIWQQVYGSRRKFKLRDANALSIYLAQRYGIQVSLDEWIKVMESGETVSRARQVEVTSRSKAKSTRSFTGFLVKSYQPIETSLYGEPLLINPPQGLSLFIEDFTHFRLADDVTVVSIENGENFQHIEQMRHLFKNIKVLFVSRYPQSSDLRTWLRAISNPYLHFGDFDLAGIHIFLTEFFTHLGLKARFFIPSDIETRLQTGNTLLYNLQYERFKEMKVIDERLKPLVAMIHRYRRIYEQEGYLQNR